MHHTGQRGLQTTCNAEMQNANLNDVSRVGKTIGNARFSSISKCNVKINVKTPDNVSEQNSIVLKNQIKITMPLLP